MYRFNLIKYLKVKYHVWMAARLLKKVEKSGKLLVKLKRHHLRAEELLAEMGVGDV